MWLLDLIYGIITESHHTIAFYKLTARRGQWSAALIDGIGFEPISDLHTLTATYPSIHSVVRYAFSSKAYLISHWLHRVHSDDVVTIQPFLDTLQNKVNLLIRVTKYYNEAIMNGNIWSSSTAKIRTRISCSQRKYDSLYNTVLSVSFSSHYICHSPMNLWNTNPQKNLPSKRS